jgi:UDP-N-acetyl-D-glucosamine dehydrogenase
VLARRGGCVSYTDPYVPTLKHGMLSLSSVPEAQALASKPDCVIIATDHEVFDYTAIVRDAQLVVDTRNALKGRGGAHIRRL